MASGKREKRKTKFHFDPFATMANFILFIFITAIIHLKSADALKCFCRGHCPNLPSDVDGECHAKPGARCFASVEMVTDPETDLPVPEHSYGCLPPDESSTLQCRGSLVPHANPSNISCCWNGDLCNKDLKPMYNPLPPGSEEESGPVSGNSVMSHETSIALLGSLTVCMVILIIFVAFVYLKYSRNQEYGPQKYVAARQDPERGFLPNYGGTLSDLLEYSSGSTLPSLVQQTIARQIQFVKEIGRGRFGQVWLGRWRGEDVAVKVFFSTDEVSFDREKEIYGTVLLRHDNILGYIAADIRGTDSFTQLLLITDYHEHGSLYDYLRENSLDEDVMLHMAYSAARGISHLHSEIQGTGVPGGKPMIAHRDIKTRNILVKKDLTCAIADFGLAISYNKEKNVIDAGKQNTRVGTRRYMAPEVLDGSLDVTSFEAFLKADIYSFGLVLWELSRRTVTGEKEGCCEAPELPYFEFTSSNPSEDEMKSVVCSKNMRPEIPIRWGRNETLTSLSKIMCETWHTLPSVRPSDLRLKKSIASLIYNYDKTKKMPD